VSGTEHVAFDLPYGLIQAVRLIDALSEADARVAVPTSETSKFSSLCKEFHCSIPKVANGNAVIAGIRLSHSLPLTQVGSVIRPIIFSHRLVNRCHEFWRAHRRVQFLFAGLVTPQRRDVIEAWAGKILNRPLTPLLSRATLCQRLMRRLLGYQPGMVSKVGNVTIWSSERGRTYPYKAWDRRYFQAMADAEFVICPDGDFPWTYRFFEAILCGAVPVVETPCLLYEPFQFYDFDSANTKLVRTPAMVSHNFDVCRRLLTCDADELKAAINELLAQNCS
jgi:hypothetical protein